MCERFPRSKLLDLNDSNLQEFKGTPQYPSAAVVGIAGPVDNNVCKVTNITHWEAVDGQYLALSLGIPYFRLLNDFAAAGL